MSTKVAPCDLSAIQFRALAALPRDSEILRDVQALIDESCAQRAALQWSFNNLVEIEKNWDARWRQEAKWLIGTLARVPSVDTEDWRAPDTEEWSAVDLPGATEDEP